METNTDQRYQKKTMDTANGGDPEVLDAAYLIPLMTSVIYLILLWKKSITMMRKKAHPLKI